jgi:hypothetical protein
MKLTQALVLSVFTPMHKRQGVPCQGQSGSFCRLRGSSAAPAMWAAMLIRFMHSKECSLELNNEILVRRNIPLCFHRIRYRIFISSDDSHMKFIILRIRYYSFYFRFRSVIHIKMNDIKRKLLFCGNP